jgi:hypothetical protein
VGHQQDGPAYTKVPGSRLRYYPWTLIALLIWLGYIAGMIYLLNNLASGDPSQGPHWHVKEVAAQIMSVFFA